MPDQTYLQQAQPSTFGHYVLTFAYPALRDAERLLAAGDWVNRSPGGAGCVNGSRLGLDRDRTASLLGFDGLIDHTRDAMWQTDNLIFAYGEVPRSLELAGKVTRLMSGVVRTLEVHPERMWASLESGFSQATDLAEFVMQTCGVDYRTAYVVVGGAVRRAAAGGLRGIDLTAEMIEEAAEGRIGR